MKLKTYYGHSLQDAMNQAKKEMGDDVIILETQTGKKNGFPFAEQNMVQITTTVNEQTSGLDSMAVSGAITKSGKGRSKNFPEYLRAQPAASNMESPQTGMINEIAYLRYELMSLNRRLRKLTSTEFPEPFLTMYEKLLKTGISNEHVALFIRRAYLKLDGHKLVTQDDILETVKSEALSLIRPIKITQQEREKKQEIITILGSTGVGKTTTIMKMALHPDIFRGKQVAIISTDTYRVAATEPLKALSKIASIPVIEVSNPDEYRTAVEKLKDSDVILVDTPGRSPLFPNYIREHQSYFKSVKSTNRLLIMSMTSDLDDLYLVAGVFLPLNPTGIIFTKIDETSKPGKMISILEEVSLPVAYITDGQSIPNDIQNDNGEFVWERIIQTI